MKFSAKDWNQTSIDHYCPPQKEEINFHIMASPAGFEPATDALEGRYSIQLSYREIKYYFVFNFILYYISLKFQQLIKYF